MARDARQSDNYSFKVVQEQIIHEGRKLPFWGNFREDTKECLGMTSESYGLVQNDTLIDTAEQALATRGLKGFERKIIVAGNGEQLFVDYVFKDKTIASAVGEIFGYILRLRNSFDRSLRASFELGLLRLTCTNGCSTMEKEFSVTRKHSSSVTVDFLGAAIENAFASGKNALKIYDQMAQIAITEGQGVNILDHFEASGALSGTLRDNIKTLWLAPRRKEDKARNLWNLYNAATDYLTHTVEDDRYVYANKVNSGLLMRLANAARVKATLQKLIIPVESTVKVIA